MLSRKFYFVISIYCQKRVFIVSVVSIGYINLLLISHATYYIIATMTYYLIAHPTY